MSEILMAIRIWHKYSGKPRGTLRVPNDGKWHKLDATVSSDPVSGVVLHHAYLNPTPVWKPGKTTGAFLVRWMRINDPDGAAGATAYPVLKDMGCKPFVNFVHPEAGRKGVGGYIQIKVRGGLAALDFDTRYSKSMGVGED